MIYHKVHWAILVGLLIILTNTSVLGQNTIGITEEVIDLLQKNQTNRIYKKFDSNSKGKITKRQLKTMWSRNLETYGDISHHGKVEVDTANDANSTKTEIYQEKNTLTLVLRLTIEGKIDRFFFLPQTYSMPDAAKNIVFGKKQLTVRTDTFELNGELIFPLNQTNAPVVILVHGSGAADLDETIGPNKIFKDLALELAVKGIATFRYNKRSFSYPESFEAGVKFTISDETTADASSAIKLLSSISEIDSNRIFVLGHSLGAYAAPLIASRNPELSGIIMLAGPSQQLYELIPVQFAYIFSLDDKNRFIKKRLLKRIDKQSTWLKSGDYGKFKNKTYAGTYWPANFFKDLETYSPVNVLKSLSCPVLILQGERDYQVPYETQFVPFQNALGDDSNVTLHSFEGLNHLFIYGEGNSVPSEYIQSGHVEAAVIESIVDWINTP
jgi:uncharacterized protein